MSRLNEQHICLTEVSLSWEYEAAPVPVLSCRGCDWVSGSIFGLVVVDLVELRDAHLRRDPKPDIAS